MKRRTISVAFAAAVGICAFAPIYANAWSYYDGMYGGGYGYDYGYYQPYAYYSPQPTSYSYLLQQSPYVYAPQNTMMNYNNYGYQSYYPSSYYSPRSYNYYPSRNTYYMPNQYAGPSVYVWNY